MTPSMNPTLNDSERILNAGTLRFLAGCPAPCLTIVLPDHHPGAQEGARQVILRYLVRDAAEQLASSPWKEQADQLLAPLRELVDSHDLDSGGSGFSIFRSAEVMAKYRTAGQSQQRTVLGNEFLLFPLLTGALAPQDFFVLGISRKHLRLIEYKQGTCRELPLPPGVPKTLEEAEDFDKPEHRLEGRSAAGSSVGSMKGVSFGTSADREAAPAYLHQYFVAIDRGLKPALSGKPVLLCGVHEEVQAYLKAASYPYILHSEIRGNIDVMALREIGDRASQAALEHYVASGERVLMAARELTDRSRVASGAQSVLKAASEARVHQVCIRGDASTEDLLNTVAVETLRSGGEVFLLPADRMSEELPVVAILRY